MPVRRNYEVKKAGKEYSCVNCGGVILKGDKYYSKPYADSILAYDYATSEGQTCGSTPYESYLHLTFCSKRCLDQLFKKERSQGLIKNIDHLREAVIRRRGLIKT